MPAEVNVIMPLPATFTATLPADDITLTLLVPDCIDVASMPVNALPLPLKKLPVMLPVAEIKPAVMMFPDADIPVVPSKLIAISQSFILHIYS